MSREICAMLENVFFFSSFFPLFCLSSIEIW